MSSQSCVCKGDQRCVHCADQTPLLPAQSSVAYPSLPQYNNQPSDYPTAPSPHGFPTSSQPQQQYQQQQQQYPIAQPVYTTPPPPQYAMPNGNPNGNGNPQFFVSNNSSHPEQLCVVDRENEPREGFIMNTLRLMLFHFLNGILATAAFTFVITGVVLSIGLLPLCCFGIVVFRVLLLFVGLFAQLDVRLYNLIAPKHHHVYVDLPEQGGFFAASGTRLSPSLSSFSPSALMALLYFGTVKFAIGTLSMCVLSVVVPIHVMVDDHSAVLVFPGSSNPWNSDPVGFVLAMLLLILFGIVLMRLVAKLSTAVTRFICCERFAIYQYVAVGQNIHAHGHGNGNYGPYYSIP